MIRGFNQGVSTADPNPTPGPLPLDYAPDPRRRRWKRRVTRTALGLFVVVIGWITWSNRDEISLRARRIYWARQCIAHVTPPGRVLVENDPIKAKALADSNPDYVYRPATSPPGASVQYQAPHAWAEYIPRKLRQYEQTLMTQLMAMQMQSMEIPFDDAVIFLGSRKTPAGLDRIVVIRGTQSNAVGFQHYFERATTILARPNLIGSLPATNFMQRAYQNGRYADAELKAGVADPNDPTHLTIDFKIPLRGQTLPAREGTLDIYLRDDDTFDIRVRDPATTQGL